MFAEKFVADRPPAIGAQLAMAALAAAFGVALMSPATAQAGPVPHPDARVPDVRTIPLGPLVVPLGMLIAPKPRCAGPFRSQS